MKQAKRTVININLSEFLVILIICSLSKFVFKNTNEEFWRECLFVAIGYTYLNKTREA